MIASILTLAAGLGLLLLAGDLLVRGAVALALRLRAAQIVVGFVVGFGTSAPEFVLVVNAALTSAEALAFGNVIGANVTNAFLVLGVLGLAVRQPPRAVGGRASLFAIAGAFAIAVLGADGSIGRTDGLLLLAVFAVFLFDQFARARHEEVLLEELDSDDGRMWLIPSLVFLGFSLVLLPIGAVVAVDGAVGLARAFSVSEAMIGLTVVSLGTTMPELATALAAGRRGHHAIGIGNVIGSILFNGLAILGVAATLVPISMPAPLLRAALPAYLAAMLVVFLVASGRIAIHRWTGVALIGLYVAFIAATIWAAS